MNFTLELRVPLHHPESLKCLRGFVPPGPACWGGKDDRVSKPSSLDSWLQWKSCYLQDSIVTFWMWSAIHTPRIPRRIRLTLGLHLKLHLVGVLFLFFSPLLTLFPPLSSVQFPFWSRALTNDFHVTPSHRVTPGRTLPKKDMQAMCIGSFGTLPGNAEQETMGAQIIYKAVDLVIHSNKATRFSLSLQMTETVLQLLLQRLKLML